MKTVAYPHPVAPGQAGFREPENSPKLSRQGGPILADNYTSRKFYNLLKLGGFFEA